jgi:hypothetical protein
MLLTSGRTDLRHVRSHLIGVRLDQLVTTVASRLFQVRTVLEIVQSQRSP